MSTRPARTWTCLAAALLIGACTVTTDPPDSPGPTGGRPGVEQFREQQAVEYDLTVPRTPQELGALEGRDSALFDRDGAAFWDVRFLLPGGSSFRTSKAIAVGVFVPDRPGGLLNSITVNVQAEDRDELARLLQRDVAQLGLDAAAIDAFLASAQPGTNRVFDGPARGYLTPDVDVRFPARDGPLTLNYHFTWEPGTAPSAGASAVAAASG